MKPNLTEMEIQQNQSLMIEKLFTALFRLIQTVKIHQENNAIVVQCADEFLQALNAFAAQERYISIRIINGRFYLHDEKMNYRREAANLMAAAVKYFEMRKLHGLSFSTDVDLSQKPALLAFVKLLNGAGAQENPNQWLEQELKRTNIDWVEILQDSHTQAEDTDSAANIEESTHEQDQPPQSASCKEVAQNAYIYTLGAIKEISEKVNSGKPGGIRKALRLVQKMIDTIGEDPLVSAWVEHN